MIKILRKRHLRSIWTGNRSLPSPKRSGSNEMDLSENAGKFWLLKSFCKDFYRKLAVIRLEIMRIAADPPAKFWFSPVTGGRAF